MGVIVTSATAAHPVSELELVDNPSRGLGKSSKDVGSAKQLS